MPPKSEVEEELYSIEYGLDFTDTHHFSRTETATLNRFSMSFTNLPVCRLVAVELLQLATSFFTRY